LSLKWEALFPCPLLIKTVPNYDIFDCANALQVIIELYLSLREHHATDKLKKHFEAERNSKEYLSEIVSNLSKR
jgi:hypothetical protein